MASHVGQQFGNYRLVKLLGVGGFAEVYLGEHIHLGTFAAVKVLTSQLTEAGIEQFRNEARTVMGLRHPHILRVLDYGLADHLPFIVMDYAPQGSLRNVFPKGSCLPLSTVVDYVKQIATALQFVHDQKLIHRDIKPENILLGSQNELLLSDFGIATVAHSTLSLVTGNGAGTISYMSPEQIRGKPRTASDQYSLAIVVYEWLSGVRPFNGTYWEVLNQQLTVPPPPLQGKDSAISSEVEQVVMKALAKDPSQRYPSIEAFAAAFESVCHTRTPPRGTTLLTFHGHQNTSQVPEWGVRAWTHVVSLSWSPDSRGIVSGCYPVGGVQIWEAQTGKQLHVLSSKETGAVTWSPDGAYIATAAGNGHHADRERDLTRLFPTDVQIWNATKGEEVLTISSSYLNIAAWSPDSTQLAVGGLSGAVQIWDVTTQRCLLRVSEEGQSRLVLDITWSPDGKLIATAGNTVDLWDAETGRHLFAYSGGGWGGSWSIAWSPDGTSIASKAQVWDAKKGHCIFTLKGANPYGNLAWSPDSKYIVSGSTNGQAQIWNARDGAHIFTYAGHTGYVNAVSWSPDGSHIASGGDDGLVRVWQAM